MSALPWVRVFRHGVNRGGGILLTSQLVVTAAHCVDGVEAGHGPDVLTISIGHGPSIPAELVERADSWDLALVKLSQPAGVLVRFPWASGCGRGDNWFAPSRPTQCDPELDGHVTGRLTYECAAGGIIEAIQLTTQSNLGSYDGYSGGPVFLLPEDSNRVIGILIEQYPDRVQNDRAGGTLFAAAIAGVIEQFEKLSTAYLLRSLVEGSAAQARLAGERRASSEPSTRQTERFAEPDHALSTDEWAQAERTARIVLDWNGDFGVVDPEVRTVHQALISKWVTRHVDEIGEV